MEGTDALKAVMALPLAIHMAIDKANADGKIDWNDAGFLLDPGMKVGPFVTALKAAPKQLKDLDDAERLDLNAWAKSTYDIADDKVEEKIEKALEVAIHLAQFVGLLLPDGAPAPA